MMEGGEVQSRQVLEEMGEAISHTHIHTHTHTDAETGTADRREQGSPGFQDTSPSAQNWLKHRSTQSPRSHTLVSIPLSLLGPTAWRRTFSCGGSLLGHRWPTHLQIPQTQSRWKGFSLNRQSTFFYALSPPL